MKLLLVWMQVRKLCSSGAVRGIRNYSLFRMGLGELLVITPDRARGLREAWMLGKWMRQKS